MKVPDILVSGNHKEIKLWRRQKSIERTLERRSDLISYENLKKSPQSGRTEKVPNQFIKLRKGNEYDIYPDW